MRKLLLLLIVIISITFSKLSVAQSTYKTAIGLGVDFGYGTSVGPSIKHFFNDNNAIQGDILFGSGFATIGAYYQYHRSFKELRELKWYAGIGPEIAFNNNNTLFLVRPMVGLDYKIKQAPLSFTLDWRPTFIIHDLIDYGFASFGLGIRYTYR